MRSAIAVTIALGLLAAPAARGADGAGSAAVKLLWLPPSTTVSQLAGAGLAPGVMSPGLGTVPAQQTYLDVGQGNRVFDSLYDESLPPPAPGDCPAWQREVAARAGSAPAEIVPFLLSREAEAHGVGVFGQGQAACALGATGRSRGRGPRPQPAAMSVADAGLAALRRAVARLGPGGMLIAVARPTGSSDDPLPIGIAGAGFRGSLTSASTRTDGYVLSTDLAPTILDHLGIAVPAQMSGQPISAEGAADPAAIGTLVARMEVISPRRGPVIGVALLAWALAVALLAAVSRGRLGRQAVRGLGLSVVYLPLLLLAGAALEPSQGGELLLVALACPALALATLAALGGYRALAAAAALTVLAYAIDAIAGSPFTSLSLLGPNPGLGVRFYGIGNELEALLAVLVVAGSGAALAGFAPRTPPARAALAFLAVGLACALVFAAGRFGADVGAAIVFPAGAVVAALVVAGRARRSALLLAVAAPFAVLALLALIDLLSGANAHLTRSVLDAGGLGSLADVAQRRLQLSAHSFTRPVLLLLLPVVALLAILAVVWRDRLRAWLAPYPAVRAGLLGALTATVVGTLANDSGALLLVIGSAYLLVFAGFAWTERGSVAAEPERALTGAGR